jgi:hypothetical protein
MTYIYFLLGPVQILFYSDEDKVRVARLGWTYGLPGEVPELAGEDVATIFDGKIQAMYTFLDQ